MTFAAGLAAEGYKPYQPYGHAPVHVLPDDVRLAVAVHVLDALALQPPPALRICVVAVGVRPFIR